MPMLRSRSTFCTAALATFVSLGSLGAQAATLPDGRAYEAVSPILQEGAAQTFIPGAGSLYLSNNGEHGVISHRPFEVSASGTTVVYPSDSPPTGGTSDARSDTGSASLATRATSGGWSERDIQPPGSKFSPNYVGFAGEELTAGILRSGEPLSEGAPVGYEDIYSHQLTAGAFEPLFSATPPLRPAVGFETGFNGALIYAGANGGGGGVAAATHVLFEANDLLVPREGQPAIELGEQVEENIEAGEAGRFKRILYDSTGGKLVVVNVLPDEHADANASFGAFPTTSPGGPPGFEHAVSADGSRIVWTDGVTEDLYVREDDAEPDAKTVQLDSAEAGCGACLSGGGHYWTASADGSRVLFTDERQLTSNSTATAGAPDLYRYDFNAPEGHRLTDLTVDPQAGQHADVQGVLGAAEVGAGTGTYFVADGELAKNVNGHGDAAVAGDDNLYFTRAGETTFIATLSQEDDEGVVPFDGSGEESESGDWQVAGGYHTAEVAPDGEDLVFMSDQSLTGYDNRLTAFNPFLGESVTTPLDEVFLYDARAHELHCVSCNPRNEAPQPTEFNSYHPSFGVPVGAFFPITKVHDERAQPRILSDDGSHVFFDSGEPLVPQDTGGWLAVYEWERDGSGSCHESQGCVSLLSSGSDPESSYLLGASASGGDAFLVTRAHRVAGDGNENYDIYDAHECTGSAPCSEEAPVSTCTGAECEQLPVPAPTFSTSPTTTFTGPGNFPPPPVPPPVVKSTKPPGSKCKKGYVRQRGKCVKRRPVKRKPKRAKKSRNA